MGMIPYHPGWVILLKIFHHEAKIKTPRPKATINTINKKAPPAAPPELDS
jgi:hypothetical protein